MALEAGKLNRLLTIQRPVKTRGSMGGEIISWVHYTKIWAEKVPQRMGERMAAAQIREAKQEMFRVRSPDADGITTQMRILYNNQAYKILGVDEIEVGVSTEIIAEYLEGHGGS